MDSAFFSDAMVRCLEKLAVEYTISVPFERFVVLKERIQKRILWWEVPGRVMLRGELQRRGFVRFVETNERMCSACI